MLSKVLVPLRPLNELAKGPCVLDNTADICVQVWDSGSSRRKDSLVGTRP